MTNEEAIEVLKNDIEICTIQQKQAIDKAIEALEQMDIIDTLIDPRDFIESEDEYEQRKAGN